MNTYKNYYQEAKLNLMQKFIEELQFEDIIHLEYKNGLYGFTGKNFYYQFQAEISQWSQVWVKKGSLHTYQINNLQEVIKDISIHDFICDLNLYFKMSGQDLALFLEEANQTLYSDVEILMKKSHLSTELSFLELEQLSLGHPKILLNKGRIGWGANDLNRYAPESSQPIKLIWLAINKKLLVSGKSDLFDEDLFYKENQLSPIKGYLHLAVHPWQWDRFIKIQYMHLIVNGSIKYIGERGNPYYAQSSLRTLSSFGHKYDLKLSLSILNTSCIRGIPQKYIRSGYKISDKLTEIINNDEYLNSRMQVLKEVCAQYVNDYSFKSLENSSYRFHEMLGMVIRENVNQFIASDEQVVSSASLLLKRDNSYFKEVLNESGLSISHWLENYFNNVFIPLYHLQNMHGLGLVSHGQNILVKMKNFIPSGVIIKDFHGDLRIADNSIHLYEKSFMDLEHLAPNHLIHDLYTGHIVTFLRYFSRLCSQEDLISEMEFYALMRSCIQNYENTYEVPKDISLLRSQFEKILINKVRFSIGYDELSRPRPILGRNIINPIVKSELLYENL